MARIRDESVDAVKASADMVEVVSARTQLRRVGARYTGRCPFHEERTPSFSVNPQDKLFYCFGCGKGGDLISFVRETENLDFAEAVEWLADRYNVQLEYEATSPQADAHRKRRERLLALLEQATAFYERYLWESSAGEGARAFFDERGLREEVCREYRLGFAPGGATLARKAREKGFTGEELLAAGLVNRRGNDYFSGRPVFPLADARGRVLGLGARRLREDDPLRAKYVNSPEGELFHKAAVVYGLDRARQAIAKEDRALVVEGYTDVLALRQEGIEPVVASMGTALTERQLKELARLTHRIYLCFDADAAGEDATLRGMELAVRMGFDVHVVPLPAGFDPAEAATGFEERLRDAVSYARHRVKLEIDRAPSREEAFRRLRDVLGTFERDLEWLDASRYAAERLDLPPDFLSELPPQVTRGRGEVSPRLLSAADRLERDTLAGCVAHSELLPLLGELSPDHFQRESHRRLRAQLLAEEEEDDELLRLRAELAARAESVGIDEVTGKQLLLRLREHKLRRQLQEAGDLALTKELQEQLERIRETVEELSSAQAGARLH